MNGALSDHYCMGCMWGRYEGDRFFCLFVEGSCARLPETILEPVPELASAHELRLENARRRAAKLREEKERREAEARARALARANEEMDAAIEEGAL